MCGARLKHGFQKAEGTGFQEVGLGLGVWGGVNRGLALSGGVGKRAEISGAFWAIGQNTTHVTQIAVATSETTEFVRGKLTLGTIVWLVRMTASVALARTVFGGVLFRSI
jgi:hypothetical protein